MYITSQIIVFIGLIIDLGGRFFKSKKMVVLSNVIASLFFVVSYIFLQSWLGAVANTLNLVRNAWYVHIEEKQKPHKAYWGPVLMVFVCFIPILILCWNSALDLFVLFSLCITTFGFLFSNVLYVRLAIIMNGLLWAVYNFSIQGYVNLICDISSIMITLISLIMYHVIPAIRKQQDHATSST